MSYYQGDFYQGDFYRGDPGFFSFLGGIGRSLVGMIPGVGPVASKVLGAGGALAAARSGVVGTLSTRAGSMVRMGRGAILKHPVLSGAAAAGTIGALGGGMAGRMGRRRAPLMPGMRRHRRMRVTNPKALRRALRRAQGFEKLARRVLHITSHRAVKIRGFKRVGRKRR